MSKGGERVYAVNARAWDEQRAEGLRTLGREGSEESRWAAYGRDCFCFFLNAETVEVRSGKARTVAAGSNGKGRGKP